MKCIHSVGGIVGVVGVDAVLDSWVCSETPVLAVVGVVAVDGDGVAVGELVVGLAMEVDEVLADVDSPERAVDGTVEGVVGDGELLSVDGLLSFDGGALVEDSVVTDCVVSVVSVGTVVSSVVVAVSVFV